MLKVNELAPLDLEVFDSMGAPVSLRSLLSKVVILYFYPKDSTPGCTVEACEFRDANQDLGKLGAVVVGVSKDSSKSHIKFQEKQSLNFPLWSDPEHKLMEAFGVWTEKKFMGRTYMGALRSTFIIGPDGRIAAVFPEVKPVGHATEVLQKVRELSLV